MENRKLDKDHEIKYFEGIVKQSVENRNYSVHKIDTLIITISGASIYVILEIFKYSLQNELKDLFYLKFSGFSFVFSIIINLISQYTGKLANHYSTIWGYRSIDQLFYMSDTKEKVDEVEKKSDKLSLTTEWCNWISLGLLSIGLITLIIFFIITF